MSAPNMKVLKKSRKAPEVGDVFVLQILPGVYHWGKLISKSANIGGFTNCNLIYIYDVKTTDTKKIPDLDKNNLLVPPIATNDLPWKKGYFQTISNTSLEEDDTFSTHCFEDLAFKRFMDENGNRLESRVEPCGIYALSSYASIDDHLSKALDIPLAPE